MSSTPGRHPRFSRERIAEVAFEIADREGFEAVSMRRVAQELGAGTMTLYHYLRTKDELVALMDDRAMGELLLPEAQLAGPWRQVLLTILRRSYRLRILHPWSLVALQNAAYGRNALRHAEQTLAALEQSPFTDEQKLTVMAVTDAFVDGYALHVAELRARRDLDPETPHAYERVLREIDEGPYPRLRGSRGLRRRQWMEADRWMDEAFERGLAALLEGLVLELTTQS